MENKFWTSSKEYPELNLNYDQKAVKANISNADTDI